jgi:hypothetical protein
MQYTKSKYTLPSLDFPELGTAQLQFFLCYCPDHPTVCNKYNYLNANSIPTAIVCIIISPSFLFEQ